MIKKRSKKSEIKHQDNYIYRSGHFGGIIAYNLQTNLPLLVTVFRIKVALIESLHASKWASPSPQLHQMAVIKFKNRSPTEVTNIEVVRMLVTSNQLQISVTNIDVDIINIKRFHFGQRPFYLAFLMMYVFFNGSTERLIEPYF